LIPPWSQTIHVGNEKVYHERAKQICHATRLATSTPLPRGKWLSPKFTGCLREFIFRMSKKLEKKSRAAQKETARTTKKRHQFVREKY